MKLKERINNIKELLSYCDHEEISIRDDKSRKFLYKFFVNKILKLWDFSQSPKT